MSIKVSQEFKRTSTAPIDETLALTKAQMLTVDDSFMPDKYFTICQDDGALYLYNKNAIPSTETGKFTEHKGGNGGTVPAKTYVMDWDETDKELKLSDGSSIQSLPLTGLQSELTPGTNITIDPTTNTISATGGSGVPAGGTTGQALVKKSDTDQDVEWKDVQEKVKAGRNITIKDDGKTVGTAFSVPNLYFSNSNKYATVRNISGDSGRPLQELSFDTNRTGFVDMTITDGENTAVKKPLQEKVVAGRAITIGEDGKTIGVNPAVPALHYASDGKYATIRNGTGENGEPLREVSFNANTNQGYIEFGINDGTNRTARRLQTQIFAGSGLKMATDGQTISTTEHANYGEYHNGVERAVGKINYDGVERTVYQTDFHLFNPGQGLKSKGQYFDSNTHYNGIYGFKFSSAVLANTDISIIDTDVIGGATHSPKPGNTCYSINSDNSSNTHQFTLSVWHYHSKTNPLTSACDIVFGVTNGQAYANVPHDQFVAKTAIFARIRYVKL